jgi:alkylglycerol monooxygenase
MHTTISNDLIFWAFPFFIITMLIEWKVAPQVYVLKDTFANLSSGLGQVIVSLFSKIFLWAIYASAFDYLHHDFLGGKLKDFDLTHLSPFVSWLIATLVMDCAYYFFHRYSHEIHFLWSAHVVHHQSEEYNLSVALRQSWFQHIYSGIFYLPLALFMPLEIFVLSNLINTLGQYWIHTKLINRIGWLENIINTPSHHRVHHATNEKYLDKNYAGILIIWDRMFGTFEPEDPNVEIRYGVLRPLASFNPIYANFQIPQVIYQQAKAVWLKTTPIWTKIKEVCYVFFAKPSWFDSQQHENQRESFGEKH